MNSIISCASHSPIIRTTRSGMYRLIRVDSAAKMPENALRA